MPRSVILGRATLALVPATWLTAFLTRPVWSDAPLVDGLPHHPLVTAFMAVSLAVGFASPVLLLPCGTMAHATIEPDGMLTVVTVLGRRRVDLAHLARVGSLTLRGRYAPTFVLYVRSGRFRWAFVSLGTSSRLPPRVRQRIRSAATQRPGIVSTRARALFRLGPRPGLARRFVLGALTAVAGSAAMCGSWLLVSMVVCMGCVPLLGQ